ncbi:hypothetical protein ACFQ3W_25565 [Paenibacillus puldeungensis]|uniref:Uncharacterized protein n=1 Tax=Paenibacillus puldeungensis TaxID=696536 RepID=A0ABW3S4F5_9BACL
MKIYNPSNNNIHQVEICLLDEEGYKGAVIIEIGGNVRGSSIIQGAIDTFVDGDFFPIQHELNERHIDCVSDDGYPELIALFKDGNDEELLIDMPDIEDYIVGAKIISVRDRN